MLCACYVDPASYYFFFPQPYNRCSGGYEQCHKVVLSSGSELIDHRENTCVVCNPKSAVRRPAESPTGSTAYLGSLSSVLRRSGRKNKKASETAASTETASAQGAASGSESAESLTSDAAQDDAEQKSGTRRASSNEAALISGATLNSVVSTVGSLMSKWKKNFRATANVIAGVSESLTADSSENLATSDGAAATTTTEPNPSASDDAQSQTPARAQTPTISLSQLLRTVPSMKTFLCQRVLHHGTEQASLVPRLLIITQEYVLSLEPTDNPDRAKLKSRHRLALLDKITSSKKVATLISLYWTVPGQEPKKQEHYLVDEWRACIDVIRERFLAIKQQAEAAEPAESEQ